MKLLVIIVTYNAMQWAKRCFDSLQTSTIAPDVFVVDNGSTDGTQAYIQDNYPKTLFQQSKENLGFGAANNIGLRYALENNYDYVYLLNQDAWVMPDTFEKMIKISQDNPEFGLISPMQMNADLYHIDKILLTGICSCDNNQIINDLYNNNLKPIYEVTPCIMAAHWFLTKECIKKVGGFSPTFKHYGEDNNYLHRTLYHQLRIGIAPQQKVVHDRGCRIYDSKKMIFFYHMSFIVSLSNPLNGNMLALFAKESLRCIKHILEYKSLKPLMYYWKSFFSINKIKRNKMISQRRECAFLE